MYGKRGPRSPPCSRLFCSYPLWRSEAVCSGSRMGSEQFLHTISQVLHISVDQNHHKDARHKKKSFQVEQNVTKTSDTGAVCDIDRAHQHSAL